MDNWGCGMCLIDSAGNHEVDYPLYDSQSKGEVMSPAPGYIEPSYHPEYLLRRELDEAATVAELTSIERKEMSTGFHEAIAQRDEAARLFLKERKRTEKLEQERDKALDLMKKWMDIAAGREEQAERLKAKNSELVKRLFHAEKTSSHEMLIVAIECKELQEQNDNLLQWRDRLIAQNDEMAKRLDGLSLAKDLYILPMEQQVQDCMRREQGMFQQLREKHKMALAAEEKNAELENKRLIKMVKEGGETDTRLRLREVERERDDFRAKACITGVSRAHWRESFERVSGERDELVKALKYYKSAGRIDINEPADDCLCDLCMATRRIQSALAKVEVNDG